ncbi:MAG: 50S ribosomal protein L6 [Spirochaetae bacterium HGW-Spirochaetae-9]|nr:MAG: 50S ribosomal protein L6 [Spirochaetae bacterium HGW-Spirochaetae-9]
MSRIGIRPVQIPQGVKVNITPTMVSVEGPKGKLSQVYLPEVDIVITDGAVHVSRKSDSKQAKACHGLYRNLVNNMVIGVSEGFKKALIVNGVGYRAEVQGNFLVMSLGFSSDFTVVIPQGLTVAIEANGQKVLISGADRELLGKFASEVRSLRKPEPYKGKGIRYDDEKIRRKVGKTGVK